MNERRPTTANKACGAAFVLLAVAGLYSAYEYLGPVTVEEPLLNYRGKPNPQPFQLMPALRPFYTQAEAEWDMRDGLQYAKDNWSVPIAACVVYYFGVVLLLRRVMEHQKQFDLQLLFAAWNWALAVFSLVGTTRTVPHLLYRLRYESFEATICGFPTDTWGSYSTGLWVQLFIFSKVPELIDTLFIVLRKRKLIVLHWYHHVTVLLYCWHSYATESGAGLWFVAMNYTVHALMYAYFAFSTLRLVPKWFPPSIITVMQIAQMFIGMFVCGMSIFYTAKRFGTDNPCSNDTANLVYGALMYFSYLILFLRFAFSKYFTPKQKEL
ncbi:putative fatty acid elongation protein 3 [Diplonema papillatum]|nr:putative fatty acid elongation protein 3 [Diplonema papillatum]